MPRFIRQLAWLVAVMVGVICAAPAARAQGSWVKLAPFPEPAEEISGASAGGKMYVFAGLAPVWKPVGMVYEYDPATNRWAKKKPTWWNTLQVFHHVGLLVNGPPGTAGLPFI